MMFVKVVLIIFAVVMTIGIFSWIFKFIGGIATIFLGALSVFALAAIFVFKVISFPIRLPFKIRKNRKEMEELRLETERIANMSDDPRGYDDVYF